jgi:basic amino acid/polyamine antiporter, APA family
MSQLFQRKPIAVLVHETEDLNGLKRSLGAGDLIMLAIGAVIGAGIFGAIGTAAAGQPPWCFPSCCWGVPVPWPGCATPN